MQQQSSRPFVKVAKKKVSRYSDVVLPRGSTEPVSTWLRSQPEGTAVTCRNRPERHGNAGKRSTHAKSEAVLEMFLEFVDSNSTPNGRKEGSHGATYYFNPKFSAMRTPNLHDRQYEYKCNHSVLYELNRSLEEKGMKDFRWHISFLAQTAPPVWAFAHCNLTIVINARSFKRKLPEPDRL